MQSDQLTIEHADLDDPAHASAVVSLLDHYARGAMGGGNPLPADVQAALIPALRKQEGRIVLLAMCQTEPLGLAIAFTGFSTFRARPLLNLHDLAVHSSARGRGIGKALLAAIEKEARQLGCCKVTLEVRSDNDVALGLYRHVGFAPSDATASDMYFWAKPLD